MADQNSTNEVLAKLQAIAHLRKDHMNKLDHLIGELDSEHCESRKATEESIAKQASTISATDSEFFSICMTAWGKAKIENDIIAEKATQIQTDFLKLKKVFDDYAAMVKDKRHNGIVAMPQSFVADIDTTKQIM